jgi:hypothetical protein
MAEELKVQITLDNTAAHAQAARFRADQQAMNAALLADATKTENAKVQVMRDAQGRFITGSRAVAESVKQDFVAQSDAIGGAAKALGSFAVQMVGLDSARAVIGAIVDNFEQARKSAYDAGKMVTDYRESLAELAALKSKLGQTTEAIGEDITFRSKTLQTAAAAREFQLAALGVGESAIGNAISKGEFRKAMELGGAFQAVEGGSAEAHGVLTGLIPTLSTAEMTGEDVARKRAQLYKIMQPGGFSFSSGIQQFAKLAPLITSGTYKDTEAAALLSAFSTANREGAGEEVQQFTRATTGMIGKRGRVTMEGGETLGKYFSSLGIDEDLIKATKSTQLPFEIGNRIAADVERQKAAAEAKGDEFSELYYLKQKGYANVQDINAIMAYHGLKRTGALDKTFLPLAAESALPTAAEATGPTARAQAADPMMMARRAALAEQAAQVAVGAGEQEFLTSIKRTAQARRFARHETAYGRYGDVQALGTLDPRNVLFGERRRTDLEAQRMLWAEAERVGVPVPRRAIRMPWTSRAAADRAEGYQGDEALFALGEKVREAGGNPAPGAEAVTAAAQRQLEASGRFERGEPAGGGRAVQVLEQINKKLSPPVQAPPVKPMVGPPRVDRR